MPPSPSGARIPETPEQLAAAMDQLTSFFELAHTWQTERDQGISPTVQPGSPLAADDWWTDPYQTSHMVQHSIGVAVDHLHALRAAVLGGNALHTHACYTLLRGALEAGATAAYLLGPSSRDERIVRRLQLAHGDDVERAKLLTVLGEPDSRTQEERLASLRAIAGRRPSIKQQLIGVNPPGYARVVREGGGACALGGELALAAWYVCSGFAHGRQWAALAMLDLDQVARLTDTVLHVRMTTRASTVAIMTQIAFLLTHEARRLFEIRAVSHLG